MTLSPHHLRTAVIEPCLRAMADATGKAFLASPESVAMMLATAEIESGCGQAIAQANRYETGPAWGIWQVECAASFTAQDVLNRRVETSAALNSLWRSFTGTDAREFLILMWYDMSVAHYVGNWTPLSRLLMANHHACCMLARLRYLDWPGPMPDLRNSSIANWQITAADTWANAYWRGADRKAGAAKFKVKLAKAADVLAEIEAIREDVG